MLFGCGRALRSGSHGCSFESSWLLGDDYVSKALVNIIFDAFWPSAALLGLLAASVLQDASTTFSLCELLASIGGPEPSVLQFRSCLYAARPLQLEILTARAVKI